MSVLFINLDPGEQSSIDASGKQNLLQTAFNAIYPSLIKYGGKSLSDCPFIIVIIIALLYSTGTLNKVFMFDKVAVYYKLHL